MLQLLHCGGFWQWQYYILWWVITCLNVYALTVITRPVSHKSSIMSSVLNRQRWRWGRGRGKNKGSRGDGGKTRCVPGERCLVVKATDDHFLIAFSHLTYSAEARQSIFKWRESEGKEEGGWEGRRRRGRGSRKQGGGGRRERCCVCCRCHSAAARFSGRRVRWREECGKEERRGKERKGVPGQHCNSCSCSSLTGREKRRGRQREEKTRLQDWLCFFFLRKKGLIRKPVFSLADAFLYGLMQEACLEIVWEAEEIWRWKERIAQRHTAKQMAKELVWQQRGPSLVCPKAHSGVSWRFTGRVALTAGYQCPPISESRGLWQTWLYSLMLRRSYTSMSPSGAMTWPSLEQDRPRWVSQRRQGVAALPEEVPPSLEIYPNLNTHCSRANPSPSALWLLPPLWASRVAFRVVLMLRWSPWARHLRMASQMMRSCQARPRPMLRSRELEPEGSPVPKARGRKGETSPSWRWTQNWWWQCWATWSSCSSVRCWVSTAEKSWRLNSTCGRHVLQTKSPACTFSQQHAPFDSATIRHLLAAADPDSPWADFMQLQGEKNRKMSLLCLQSMLLLFHWLLHQFDI